MKLNILVSGAGLHHDRVVLHPAVHGAPPVPPRHPEATDLQLASLVRRQRGSHHRHRRHLLRRRPIQG